MCGIVGVVGRPPQDPQFIERMTTMLRHRGPDDSGVWRSPHAHIGHRRLSIIDLSAAGRQPMHLGSLTLTYNGEVYNFRELRENLSGPFVSDTDSEVILHAFREHGRDSVNLLNGMFAYAIWNEDEQRLFAVRDRLGIKPLYYRPLDGGLAFASELSPLLELGGAEIDRSALSDFLTYGYVPAPKTAWRGIYKLDAGHYLQWHDGALDIHRYWQVEPSSDIHDLDQAAIELEELLSTVVPEHVLADVPVGVFLSGGLDSTSIASFLDRAKTFTLGQSQRHRDEAAAAKRVAEHLGTEHREQIAEIPSLSAALDTVVSTFDEPFSDSSGISVWLLSRFTRQHVTVALSGEGGDEVFAGYRWYGNAMTPNARALDRFLARTMPPLSGLGRSGQRRSTTDPFLRYASFVSVFGPRQKASLAGEALGDEPRKSLEKLHQFWRPELPLPQRLQWSDLHTYLPDDLLTKVDRASMAFSLEVRPPLLDHRLVEWAFRLAPSLQRDLDTDRGKLVLRRVVEPRLPAGHLDLPKKGFNLSVKSWVRQEPRAFDSALRRLDANGIIRRPRFFAKRNEACWCLLVLDHWLREYDSSYQN